MKKLSVLLLMSIFFLCCEREELPTETEVTVQDVEDNNSTAQYGNYAVVLVGAYYYEKVEIKSGEISYKQLGYIPAGETVIILDDETIIFTIGSDTLRLKPARVKINNVSKDVLISVYYLLPEQKLGVVIADDEAEVFTGLDPVDITMNTIPRGTIIGVAPLETQNNPLHRQQFVAFKVMQHNGIEEYFSTWGEFYLDSSAISTKESDLKMAEILANLNKKDKSLWAKILDDAEKLYADSHFIKDAEIIRNLLEIPTYTVKRETELYVDTGLLNDDQVNVRTEPNEKLNNIISQLNTGDFVYVTERTVEQYTIAGYTAFWYKIKKNDLEGWIFGQFIDLTR